MQCSDTRAVVRTKAPTEVRIFQTQQKGRLSYLDDFVSSKRNNLAAPLIDSHMCHCCCVALHVKKAAQSQDSSLATLLEGEDFWLNGNWVFSQCFCLPNNT